MNGHRREMLDPRRSQPRLIFVYACTVALFSLIGIRDARAGSPVAFSSTNAWQLAETDHLERVAFVFAPVISVAGRSHDDIFLLGTASIHLSGSCENDAWALAPEIHLTGTFGDHARALGQNITVDGVVSNGLWAAGLSVSISTNAYLVGDQFIWGDNITALGKTDGNLHMRGRRITLGGIISGNVFIYGEDIVVRPGTTINGDLIYITTNQPIVLDARSTVHGEIKKILPPVSSDWWPRSNAWLTLYWFAAALPVGIGFMLLFPQCTGRAVRYFRSDLWKCGLIGLAVLFGLPLLIVVAMASVLGIPFALLASAGYAILLYLGKYFTALALGTALLNRRGEISLFTALLALVIGLVLFYSAALIPFIGSSLQTAATVFGTGSLVLTLAAGRGKLRSDHSSTNK